MRNKVLPARALYRLVSGGGGQQQSATSSASSTATASTGGSSTTTCSSSRIPSRVSSSIASNARLSRAATVAARRRQEANVSSTSSSAQQQNTTTGNGNTSSNRKRRSTSSAIKRDDDDSSMIFVNPTVQHLWSQLSSPTTKSPRPFRGIAPVQPPQTSLTNVALQDFFAAQRPLLEHSVVASSGGSDGGMSISDEESGNLASLSAALLESLQESGHLSESDIGNTKFVMTSTDKSFPQRVEGIEQDRFVNLLDRLSGLKKSTKAISGEDLVRSEARKLDNEQSRKKDIEEAVNNAIERGEDPSTAKALGTEADLVILGEPEGPNPSWARGTASHLAQSTRAFEPPSAPVSQQKSSSTTRDVKVKGKDVSASIKIIEEREDDPNLLLSYAMVQATLPPALAWDRLVARMNAATLEEKGSLSIVDVGLLDAELFANFNAATKDSVSSENGNVEMDSTKRKRRKKMRKHKYRKLRKATRIERSRLKK